MEYVPINPKSGLFVCHDCGTESPRGYMLWCEQDGIYGDGDKPVMVYCRDCRDVRLRNFKRFAPGIDVPIVRLDANRCGDSI